MTTAQHTHSNETIQEALDLLNEAALEKQSEIRNLLAVKYQHLRAALTQLERDVSKREYDLITEAQDRVAEVAWEVDRRVRVDPWSALGLVSVGALLVGFMLGRRD